MSQIIESFQRDLAEVSWRELRVHQQRDAIIMIAGELDLIEAAVAVADDEKDKVEQWVAAGLVGKPDKEQVEAWESDLDRPFRMLIVQPFILIQSVYSA